MAPCDVCSQATALLHMSETAKASLPTHAQTDFHDGDEGSDSDEEYDDDSKASTSSASLSMLFDVARYAIKSLNNTKSFCCLFKIFLVN